MKSGPMIKLALTACLIAAGMATHHHSDLLLGNHSSLADLLLDGNAIGLPFNNTLRMLTSGDDDLSSAAEADRQSQLASSSILLRYIAYPFVALARHKVNALRALVSLPVRVAMAPVDAARALWRTGDAFRHPFNATLLGRMHHDLHRLTPTAPSQQQHQNHTDTSNNSNATSTQQNKSTSQTVE